MTLSKVKFTLLPQFSDRKINRWPCHIIDKSHKPTKYDMIIGRDLLQEIGLIVDWKDLTMTWEGCSRTNA
eukprot:scaffold343876_cov75-Attheya_sp.AAC.3